MTTEIALARCVHCGKPITESVHMRDLTDLIIKGLVKFPIHLNGYYSCFAVGSLAEYRK